MSFTLFPHLLDVSVRDSSVSLASSRGLGRKAREVREASWGRWRLNRALKEGDIRIGGDRCLAVPERVA